MTVNLRLLLNKLFTTLALLSVLLIVAALIGILAPILWRGGSAVVFKDTLEFRRLQLEQFGRGDPQEIEREVHQAAEVRQRAYDLLDRFSAGLDTKDLQTKVRQVHTQVVEQFAGGDMDAQQRRTKTLSRELRDELLEALDTDDAAQAEQHLQNVLSHKDDPLLRQTAAQGFAVIAEQYHSVIKRVDLKRRAEYATALGEVREELCALLGPRLGDPQPALIEKQYGATRWDAAQQHLDRLLYAESWVEQGQGVANKKVRIPRDEQFAGTDLAALFPLLREHSSEMLLPQWTCYWQYFIDDNFSGHYLGGCGPEILGTLLITVLSIVFALPLGVVAAAHLVECAADSLFTRILRTCINTLAGVPSIVFGLFGLAFFVIYVQPRLGLPPGSSILAGALTLALLVLPVIIRASEEAIRAVPRAYREASLSLGASRFRCFVGVTLPAALPGILTGLILSMSRAAGETAPILFTAGIAMGKIPQSLAQPTRTLSYGSYDMAVGDKMAALAPHNQFGMVMTLVAVVLILNIVAIVLRGRLSKRLRGL